MNTNTKGNVGLAMVIANLVKRGYDVFLPFADTTCVDLIVADSEMNLHRIQVKFSKIDDNGRIVVKPSSVVNGKVMPADLSKTDWWIIYCPDNEGIYFLPSRFLAGKKEVALRVSVPKQAFKNMNYASDFMEFI